MERAERAGLARSALHTPRAAQPLVLSLSPHLRTAQQRTGAYCHERTADRQHSGILFCIPDATEGPPIEIAWAMLASEAQGVICESRLIRPPATWTPEFARNPPALQAYELTVSDLRDYGAPICVIAAHMNATLANRELFSAKVVDDARIRRIFEAAKIAPEFALRKTDAIELIAEMARMRRIPPVALARAKREAEVMVPDRRPR